MTTDLKKNFEVRFLNSAIGSSFFEEGFHHNYSDQELIEWFLERQKDGGWSKIPDVEIKEKGKDGNLIERLDLVMKIIKPVLFQKGQIVSPVFLNPLPERKVSPNIQKDTMYPIKDIALDNKGNQHLDIGLVSKYEFIRSYETGENLPNGDKIHWCHPGRFELAV